MAEIPLMDADGVSYGFADISDKGDAIYYFDRLKADFILFDTRLIQYPAARFILRNFLLGRMSELKKAKCLGMAFGLEIPARLSQFGLSLIDTDLALPGFDNEILALPEPEENRRIGDLDVSTGSGWLKRLNLRL
jgi:hypothetical protein